MKDDWEGATDLVKCIAVKLLEFNSGGLTLHFLNGRRCVPRGTDAKSFQKCMDKEHPDNNKPTVSVDVSKQLGECFDEYRNSVDRRINDLQSMPNPMTVIVLTNGLWTQNGDQAKKVRETIVNCIKQLREPRRVKPSLGDRPFSVEFVLFGEDETAKTNFTEYDDEIKHTDGCDGQ